MPVLSSEDFIKLQNKNHDLKVRESINHNTSLSFNHETITDVVESNLKENNYIGYLIIDNQIVASGFGKKEPSNSKYDTIYLHTFSVHSDYRGQGLCQKIVKEFIKKLGNCILYLTVRTEPGKENTSAIKCYEKNDFIMLPSVYRDHYDGKNNAMIRLPTSNKNSIRSRRRTKTRNKRK